jgi:hypothetical protein
VIDNVKKEELRFQMINAFRIYSNINPTYVHPRTMAWTEYCQARESYLAECWGIQYRPLHELIRIPGPYD